MILAKNVHKPPMLFGLFIVAAMLPQIVGFNGSAIDSIYKLVLMAALLLVNSQRNLFIVSKYFVFVLFEEIIVRCTAIIINDASIGSEMKSALTIILLLYIFYESVINTHDIRMEDVEVFYQIIVCFMFIASLYNMIIHFNSLLHITSLNIYNTEDICSFFDNKNTFGVFLLFGVLAATVLRIIRNEIKWTVFAIVFLLNEMMAMCRTAIVLSVVLILISCFLNKKQGKKSIIIAIGLSIVIVLAICFNESFNNFILNNMFGDSSSVDIRNTYIENMIPLAKGEHFVFGYGEDNSTLLAIYYTGNQYYHNTYLKELISGGLLAVTVQISGIIISYLYGIRCRKFEKTIGNLCILSTTVYVVYSNYEAVSLFDSPVTSMMAVIFTISIPILFYNSYVCTHKSVTDE